MGYLSLFTTSCAFISLEFTVRTIYFYYINTIVAYINTSQILEETAVQKTGVDIKKCIFQEFVCPYNLSISGKQIWLDVCNGELRETILLELR